MHTHLAGLTVDQRSASGHHSFVSGDLVTWQCKKQLMVVRSGAGDKFHAMVLRSRKEMWIKGYAKIWYCLYKRESNYTETVNEQLRFLIILVNMSRSSM